MNLLKKPGVNLNTEYLLYLSIFLVPYQFLAIGFTNSSKNYDLTYLILYLIFIYFFLKKIKINYFIFITILFLTHFFLFISSFYFSYIDIPHYMSFNENKIFPKFLISFFTINLYFLILYYYKEININYDKLLNIFLLSLLISTVYLYYNYFLNDYSNTIRYNSTFNEPSFAGLFLYSSFLSVSTLVYYEKNFYKKSIFFILCLFILYSAILTKSLHIFSAIISISFILFFIFSFKLRIFLIAFIIFCIFLLFQFEFIFEKLDISIFTIEKLNNNYGGRFAPQISFYVWLQNFEQYITSFYKSPILGLGAGSIGYFIFDSFYFNILNYRFITTLNLNDGYSLLLYLLIQYGLILVVPLLFFILFRSISFIKNNFKINTYNKNSVSKKFFFIFSFTCIIGSLIKEPNLSRSTIVFAFLIFCTLTYEK